MNNKTIITILVILLIGFASGFFYYFAVNQQRTSANEIGQTQQPQGMRGMFGQFSDNYNQKNCIAGECLNTAETTTQELPEEVKNALGKAIDDEYKALTTYQVVMDKFGRQRPFTMISHSEEMHIAALKSIYDKYGVEIPENDYEGKMEAPESVQQACQQGVEGEIKNAELYRKELIPIVQDEYPDIERVFRNLMNASQSRHLPAFERCN
jgi:hypothetical protein